jgi:hypothetical protein
MPRFTGLSAIKAEPDTLVFVWHRLMRFFDSEDGGFEFTPCRFQRWCKSGLALIHHKEPIDLASNVWLQSFAWHLNHREGDHYRSSLPQWLLTILVGL